MAVETKEHSEVNPYVPHTQTVPEFTLRAIVVGSILALVFGVANAYLGLKVGMTVSASIPAAVISMAILRGIMSILPKLRRFFQGFWITVRTSPRPGTR